MDKTFEREERFIVIKRKHLPNEKEVSLRRFLRHQNIATVECVVVEADWPEYETVWRMIEDRVTGQALSSKPADAWREAAYNEEALAEVAIDFLEERADEWMADTGVQRMFNAIASVFEKNAPQEIMDRFREKLGVIGRQCFVEGALRSWEEIAAQQRVLGAPLPSLPAAPKPAAEDRTGVDRVEAVARALHRHEDAWFDKDWEYLPEGQKETFLSQARAAIAAMPRTGYKNRLPFALKVLREELMSTDHPVSEWERETIKKIAAALQPKATGI